MSGPRAEDAHKKRLRDVLESAIAFYHAVLTGSKTGEAALEYLRGRGFTDETIAKYQLGYAPGGWDTLTRQLAAKRNVRPDELVEVGLAQPRQSSRRGVYDRFRERVIFPIRDANGSPVGLGARILAAAAEDGGDHGPKYLNSPATPLFDKSRTLYLIDKAKGPIRKSSQAVIVEGYTDALMAHQAGFDNVVASLGTALTPGQIALLTRYAKRIALAYDVDAAGEKAGTFGAQALESLIGQLAAADTGVELDEVRVVRLPDGKDPDEVVREAPDRWREEVRTAQPIVDYLIDFHARQVDLKTPGGKARFVDAIAPTLRAIPNPVMRDAYLQKIHNVSGVEERSVLEILHRRPALGASAEGRITADAVLASADALPIDRILRRDHAGRGGAAPSAAARAGAAGPRGRRDRPRPAALDAGPRAVPGHRPAARPGRSRGPAAVLDVGADGRARRRDPGDRPGDPRQAVARSRARRVGADHVRRRSLPAPARADEARRAGRLGRWRAPRRGIARRPRAGRPACHPSTAEQRSPSIRGSPNRTSNRVGPSMTPGGTDARSVG